MIWRPLTIVFGALPATMLSIFAAIGLMWAVPTALSGAFTGDMEALTLGSLLVLWFSLGIYGTFSLWACGLGFPTTWARLGLVAGTLAISPMVCDGIRYGVEFDIFAILAFGPTLIACGWFLLLFLGVPVDYDEPRAAALPKEAGDTSR